MLPFHDRIFLPTQAILALPPNRSFVLTVRVQELAWLSESSPSFGHRGNTCWQSVTNAEFVGNRKHDAYPEKLRRTMEAYKVHASVAASKCRKAESIDT